MKCHILNICTILLQQIMCGKLLLILIWTHYLNYFFSLVLASNNPTLTIYCKSIVKILWYPFLILIFFLIFFSLISFFFIHTFLYYFFLFFSPPHTYYFPFLWSQSSFFTFLFTFLFWQTTTSYSRTYQCTLYIYIWKNLKV